MKQNIESFINLNPEYHYLFFNYTDRILLVLVKHFYGEEMLKLFLTINKNFKAIRVDVWRYLLVYALGGIYVDIDARLNKPFRTVAIAWITQVR